MTRYTGRAVATTYPVMMMTSAICSVKGKSSQNPSPQIVTVSTSAPPIPLAA